MGLANKRLKNWPSSPCLTKANVEFQLCGKKCKNPKIWSPCLSPTLTSNVICPLPSPPCVWQLFSKLARALKTRLGEFSDTCQTSDSHPNLLFYCFPAFDTTATSIQQSLQLALLNQDDGEGCHYHNRNHQVRRHPFKWVAQVSLLSHLTTRHQWDARLVTHTHTRQWDVACYQIVCQHQLVLPVTKRREVAWPQLAGPRRPSLGKWCGPIRGQNDRGLVPRGAEMTRGGGLGSDPVQVGISDHRGRWAFEGCTGFGFWFAAD